MHIPESDWKKFKPLRERAVSNFCEAILDELAEIRADSALSTHEKYVKTYTTVRERDKELGRIFDGYSRSTALMQLAMIQARELVEPEAFECFSQETREYLAGFK